MKRILLIIVAAIVLVGCRSSRQATATYDSRDSVRIEIRAQTYYVHDTVTVTIPEHWAERTTADSCSRLENDYAVSTARINQDGTLFHSLTTKPAEIPVAVSVPVQTSDTIIQRGGVITQTKVVKENNLTVNQKIQIAAFWLFLFVFAVTYAVKKIKAFVARKNS